MSLASQVLQQYPFATVRTARVIFEALHLSHSEYMQAAALLENAGYFNVQGGWRSFLDVWHHGNSNEQLAAGASRCEPFASAVQLGVPELGSGRVGYCSGTHDGEPGDCLAGWGGSWALGPHLCTASQCATRCRLDCPRCRYISFSLDHQECSWYHACPIDTLRQDVGGDTYLTWNLTWNVGVR